MGRGETVMLQRYLPAVDTVGEVSMVYLDGLYAYAVRKEAMLRGPETGGGRLYQAERLEGGYQPAPEELAVGEAAVAAAMDALGNPLRPFLYARADLIRDADGAPVLLELELTEPSLFPELAAGGIDQVCRAIVGRLSPV
jgi:hypothetical protein